MTTLTLTTITWLADNDWQNRWNGDGPPFPLFLFPLFWLLVVAAVVTTWLLTRRSREAAAGRRSGEQVLAERYAAGEIDAEEYDDRLAVLRRRH